MLYLVPGAALLGFVAGIIRLVRHLELEVSEAFTEFMRDIGEIVMDAVDCLVHAAILYLILLVAGTTATTAVPVAVSVGAVKLFSSDNVHPTNYFHRTRVRLEVAWRDRNKQ